MSLARGDVVLIDFPMGAGQPPKRRPAVVVQSNLNNGRLITSIFVMITSNTRLVGKVTTQVLVEIDSPSGKQSNLKHTSAVKCENVYTLEQSLARKIGSLTDAAMKEVDAALKVSLALT